MYVLSRPDFTPNHRGINSTFFFFHYSIFTCKKKKWASIPPPPPFSAHVLICLLLPIICLLFYYILGLRDRSRRLGDELGEALELQPRRVPDGLRHGVGPHEASKRNQLFIYDTGRSPSGL